MGILISSSARSYQSALTLDIAFTLSLYVSTSNKPVSSKHRLNEFVISVSSSTISILAFFASIFDDGNDDEDEDDGDREYCINYLFTKRQACLK